MDAYIGLIFPFAGAFAPQGTAQCQGQQMAIQQNQALFSIVYNMYGGDARTTFNLPDLRGRILVGAGASPFLNTTLNPGSSGGAATSTLNLANLPLHTHNATFTPGGGSSTSTINATVSIPISTAQANLPTPAAGTNYLGGVKVSDAANFTDWQTEGPYTTTPGSGANLTGTATGTVTVSGAGGTVTVSPGGGQAVPMPFTNVQPYLALTMYIVTLGYYPTRD
ncbi:Microcystin-dependent protein [Azospirillum oryzae]|uniref:Microcystin-dependent protein n=1 Tax=Azospirillum oryzae TaxID=286727 RepID=A0A1X7EYB9_9PROT|nr:tail fiber protein [Azospirillum oryzae]SMF42453.1 Microcystin-dependent protein [Azospirillum oryzae]